MGSDRKYFWTVVGSMAAVLSVLLAVWGVWPRNESSVSVFLCDKSKAPVTEVVIIFPDGQKIEPDQDGLAYIPASRIGQEASIRERSTRREISRIIIPQKETLIVTIN